MAQAKASIGTTNYQTAIVTGHHRLTADEGPALGGKDVGPGPYELLTSALAACTAITLRMHLGDREVCLLVQDNGTGFDAAKQRTGGHGLGNMRARAKRMGASFNITSAPGEGARIIATLPVLQPSAT